MISSHNSIRVFVLNKHKQPLMPCHPARARKLLSKGKAKVYRRYPFTIILINETTNFTQPIEFKLDPGSKTTGIALVAKFPNKGNVLIWAAHLQHRGYQIVEALTSRRSIRRSRRNRKTRYRAPRWANRKRPNGWIPPSLMSRVYNLGYLFRKIITKCPLTNVVIETVKFDTQLLDDPNISGVQYQQGTLQGYEVREYLLETYQRACVYCGVTNVPLQIEHVIPKSRGGSNRISNLVLACDSCNKLKGTKTAAEFGYPHLKPKFLKDTAAVNSTRTIIKELFNKCGLPVEISTGGVTKFNRSKQNLVKDHWIDAGCVGTSGSNLIIPSNNMTILNIRATSRGTRRVQKSDKYGFPRKTKAGISVKAGTIKRVHGFTTGDLVRLNLPKHSIYSGIYVERLSSIRKNGQFSIKFDGYTIDANHNYFTVIQYGDGYEYSYL